MHEILDLVCGGLSFQRVFICESVDKINNFIPFLFAQSTRIRLASNVRVNHTGQRSISARGDGQAVKLRYQLAPRTV